MMRSIEVKEGQTLLDVAMEHCGDVSAAYHIADLNGRSITDDLTVGETLLIPDVIVEGIVQVFSPTWLKPASGESIDSEVLGEGLEFWIIEQDFIIQ